MPNIKSLEMAVAVSAYQTSTIKIFKTWQL